MNHNMRTYSYSLNFLWLLLISSVTGSTESLIDDAVIIEAYEPPVKRSGRQFIIRNAWSEAVEEGGPCVTSRAMLGSCTSYRNCQPYFKLPDIGIWEAWIVGNYDTCSYLTTQGRQAFGVCCTSPVTPISEDALNEVASQQDVTVVGTKYQNWPPYYPTHPPTTTKPTTVLQWPPPIPTHPPDHQAPTHPPSFLVTTPTTTTKKPSDTSWSTKPPSYPWPPQSPTHPTNGPITIKPPASNPTTSSPPSSGEGGFQASCGAKNGLLDQERIVGGGQSAPNEWPWIVVIFNNGRQFCGGSLMDNIHILTACHCVAHMTSYDVALLTANLGDHNIMSNTEVQHVTRKIKRVIKHRSFDSRTLYNDIAILTMDMPVTFSRSIRPICLPTLTQKAYSGQIATVAGWGSIRENGPQPPILQQVSIPIWSNHECRAKYGQAAPGGITESMLCAGQAAKDSCSGDSGGPLMVNEGRWTQVGIVSWGIGCGKGQYPGVYTRVTYYMPWITKNIKSK